MARWLSGFALSVLVAAVGCGGDDDGGGKAAGTGGNGGTGLTGNGGSGGSGNSAAGGAAGGGDGGSSASGGSGGGSGGAGGSGGGGSCLVDGFLSSIGKTHLLVGASMDDAIASANPFDVRYLYLSGGIADGNGPCSSCASGCTAKGASCANTGAGCAWWGCWQYDQVPPGAYVRDFITKAKADGQIPMFTYYMILQAGGTSEGAAEVTKANDAAFMARYYADWKFLVSQIKTDVALLHIEPDFWGYAQQQDDDPTLLPAAVASAAGADCASLPNTIAGMGECMVTIAHTYAPNAKVSLHGSGWATKFDVLLNSSASFNVAGHAQKLGQFMAAAAPSADFITVDAADRDAAWYESQGQDRWWDDTNATLPNFTQAFAWSKAVGESAQKSLFWWQLPVGNMSLGNTANHWKDNRVDYFMTHMDEVAKGHAFGAAFGAGDGNQTTPSTDGGNLANKVKAYAAAGGQVACP